MGPCFRRDDEGAVRGPIIFLTSGNARIGPWLFLKKARSERADPTDWCLLIGGRADMAKQTVASADRPSPEIFEPGRPRRHFENCRQAQIPHIVNTKHLTR
jgi:hypothetical protein